MDPGSRPRKVTWAPWGEGMGSVIASTSIPSPGADKQESSDDIIVRTGDLFLAYTIPIVSQLSPPHCMSISPSISGLNHLFVGVRRNPTGRSSFSAFSVVELLVVIAIMSSLAVMGVAAFSAIGRGQKVGTSAGQVADLLEQGRALAFARSAPIRMGVVTNWPSESDKNFRSVVLLSRQDTSFPAKWTAETRVKTLPEGVHLREEVGANREGVSPLEDGLSNEMSLEVAGQSLTIRFLEFRPNGQVWPEVPGRASFFVEESAVENGDNWAEVLAHPLTGKVTIVRPGNL